MSALTLNVSLQYTSGTRRLNKIVSMLNTILNYLRGRFCLLLVLVFLVGFGKILLSPINTTCLPLNFFSSSLTNRA